METATRLANGPLAAFAVALACSFGTPAFAASPLVLAQVYLNDLGHGSSDERDAVRPEQQPRADTKANQEGTEPPKSVQETKQDKFAPPAKPKDDGSEAQDTDQNKLDLRLDRLPLLTPLGRAKKLGELYDELQAAGSADAAEPIMKTIERLWATSGSDTIDLLMSRAAQFAKKDDTDLSLAILDAVVELAPDEVEAWHQRARVHMLRGEYQPALADLRRALDLDPKHYQAIDDLGVVLEELGAKKEALEAYRKALAVNPFLDDARKAVEQLKRDVEGQDI
jgi:tetratricopeptide (TPR) repeat protein